MHCNEERLCEGFNGQNCGVRPDLYTGYDNAYGQTHSKGSSMTKFFPELLSQLPCSYVMKLN